MVCAPVPSIIPSLKLGNYLSVQAHKPCCISQLFISKESVYILERETVFAKLLLMILVGSSRSLVVI